MQQQDQQQQPKSKPCYNCVKRRIICDRSPARCRKCVKKGLVCPGYGIRYRFAHEFRDPKSGGAGAAVPPAAAPASPGSSSGVEYSGPLTWVEAETVATVSQAVARVGHGGGDGEIEDDDEDSNATTPSSESNSGSERGRSQYGEAITRIDGRIVPRFETETPRTIQLIDAKSRWMFNYFSDRVSPTMLLFDGDSNGYRRHVLPFAVFNPLVQRAVCVAAAFHLLPRRPELKAPAEQGRAAIIQRLREDGLSASGVPVLDDATWATILLLIVGDLVRGDEQVMILYHMLDAFLRARGRHQPATSELDKFLDSQSRLIKFFGEPIVSESSTLSEPSHRPNAAILNTLSGSELPPASLPHAAAYIPLYNEAYRLAMDIYGRRARSASVPVQDSLMAARVDDLHAVLRRVDPTLPGAHVLVWPHFVGAAEAVDEEQRDYFTGQLRYIWRTTGYANVLKAIDSLPGMWEKRGVQRWTTRLPQLSVVVM